MILATHDGTFHADDVFAFSILFYLHPTASLIRTRQDELLQKADIVFDVGRGQYDHHSLQKQYRNDIPYASAGLIWRDFGKRVLEKEQIPQNWIEKTHRIIDERLFQGIDALDNGVAVTQTIQLHHVSDTIYHFNKQWNEPNKNEDELFKKAASFATTILLNMINQQLAVINAYDVVKNAYYNRMDEEILILPHSCPWTSALFDLDKKEEVLFVVYPDQKKGYRLQAVPKGSGTFENRKDLPKYWAGKEGLALENMTGVSDALFCHPGRFIAGAMSFESILHLAQIASKEGD